MVQIEVSRDPSPAPLQAASGVNLADVMARLEAHPALSPRRRREMMSALRTVARLMGADLSAIPADPPGLRHRLETVSPAAGGLSQGRWNNIRSLTLAALKHAGVQTMPGRSREPLLPAWEALRAGLPNANFRHGLSRFMSFCSAQQIMPEAVDAAVFERFRAALDQDSLVKKTWTVYRTTCVLWNRAGETLPGWPELVVAVPSASRRYALAWDNFPSSFRADAEAFLYRLGNQDPFADDYAAPAKASTVQMRRKQILQIATALTCSGCPAETITDLTVLVELDNAKQALRFFFDRAGGRSTKYLHQQALLIGTIARHWVKAEADHVQALGGICRRLAVKNTGMTDKNRARLRQFDDPANVDALLSLPRRVLRQVQRDDRGLRRDALRVMLALAVEILIVAPMRVNNLVGIDIERHLVRARVGPAAVLHLVIPGEETKTSEPFEMELPAETAEFLAVYLATYRSRLASRPSTWLFPNDQGGRRVTTRFATEIANFILRETGIKMNVHLFRHVAAKLHLDAHPEDIETARRVLGHRSMTTTLKAYAETKTAAAFRRYDGMIATLRERSQMPATSLRRARQAGARP